MQNGREIWRTGKDLNVLTIMVLTQFVVDGQWRNVSDQPYCESFVGGYRWQIWNQIQASRQVNNALCDAMFCDTD